MSASSPPLVVFIEQFYFPEGWGGAEIPRDITCHLARSGLSVDVICGGDVYAPVEGEPPRDPRLDGVRISRAPRLFRGPVHRFKLARQLWFCLYLAWRLVSIRGLTLCVAQTNPPLGLVVAAAIMRLRGVPLIVIAQDVYPEVLEAHGALASLPRVRRALRAAFGWAYRSATDVVVLGPIMMRRIIEKGVAPERIREIPNWATGPNRIVRGTENRLIDEWGLEGRFVILYSGNMGIGHEFDTLIRGFEQAVLERPDLALLFVGSGSRLAETQAACLASPAADSIHFRRWVAAERVPESLGLAQVAVVTMRPGFEGLIVPSKLAGYMARGLPTLYVGPDSDNAVVLVQSGGGWVIRNGDSEGVRAALLEAHDDRTRLESRGAASKKFYDENFARERALQAYHSLMAARRRASV